VTDSPEAGRNRDGLAELPAEQIAMGRIAVRGAPALCKQCLLS
jgi:hypothetical protein